MKKIKILEVIDSAMIGGGQEHLFNLVQGLEPEKFDVAITCPDDGPLPGRLGELGVKVITTQSRSRFDVLQARDLYRVIRKNNIDIIHAHGTLAGAWGRLASIFARTPVKIYTLHGIHYLNYSNKALKYLLIFLDRLMATFTDMVICVAESDREKGLRYKLFSADKSITIHNGINVRLFGNRVDSDRKKRELNLDPGVPVIGIVARLHVQKGYQYFFSAVQKLLEEIPESIVLVVGDGPQYNSLVRYTESLGISKNVRFLGSRSDVREILSIMDVFVLSSLWEGLPLTVLEAMAAKNPVVATEVDGVREIIKHNKTGYMVPPRDPDRLADQIAQIIKQPQQTKNVVELAYDNVVANFNIEKMVTQTKKVYVQQFRKKIRMVDSAIRIGIDIRKINDYGIGTYIKNLVREFARMEGEKEEYILFHHQPEIKDLSMLKDNFIGIVDMSPKYSVRELISLPFKMKASNLDLFHSPHYVLPPIRPCKAVVTIHDLIHILFPEYLPSKYAFWYARFMLTLAARSSRKIITVSESSKKDIVKYLKIPEEKVVVIPNAIGQQFKQLDGTSWKKQLSDDFGITSPYILYVGSLAPHKNVSGLIKAYSLMRKRTGNPVQLVIAGAERKNSPDIARLLEQHDLNNSVKFLGSVPYERKKLPVLYNAAELFVFPSFYEGFGLPPLEAMACGTPVITSTCSSLPEVVGDAGLLTDPHNIEDLSDKMEMLLEDTYLQQKLVEKGFERVKQFSWTITAQKTLKVYQEVAQNG